MEYIEYGHCCTDCALAIANDDFTGVTDERETEIRQALGALNKHLIVGDEQGFMHSRCDICDGLAGERHTVGYLG